MASIRGARSAEGRYVQLCNPALQDKRLSYRARGLMASVLSYPADWRVTSETLAEQATEGRDAIRTALKELEAHGYLSRTKTHTPDGTWSWLWVITDDPAVAPVTENPSTDNQATVPPAKNDEAAGQSSDWKTADGFPGHIPKTISQHERKIPPSSVVPTAEVARSARAIQEEEEIQDQQRVSNAAQFLMDLAPPWRLGPIDAAALAPTLELIAGARGWDPDAHLAAALTANPGGINNYAAVLRTRIDNLPMRHTRPDPAAGRECRDCGRPHPNLYDNGVCPNCIRTDNRADPPPNFRALIQPTTGHPKP